jgi:plasmid stability protein
MATLTIRNLDERTKAQLRIHAPVAQLGGDAELACREGEA